MPRIVAVAGAGAGAGAVEELGLVAAVAAVITSCNLLES